MVRKGNFELRLIYADTKVPFKEHAHTDGKVYAEVEPKVEYYFQVRSHHHKQVIFKYEVDGKSLRYKHKVKRGYHDWSTRGLLHREEGRQYFTALKFNSLYRGLNHADDSDDNSDHGHWTGFVKLKVFEYIPNGHKFKEKNRKDFESTWYPDTEAIEKGLNMSKHEKACYSVEGLTKRKARPIKKKKTRDYKRGSLLESVTLHYCSTVGLIAAKVFTPTPGLTIRNNRSSSSSRPSKRQRNASSETDQVSHVVQSQTISKIVTYEVIELF